jgi:hypothetical protein
MEDGGEPISACAVKKLNFNYGVSVAVINESIKSGDKKKLLRDTKGASRNQALRTLLYYCPSLQVSESMISCMFHFKSSKFSSYQTSDNHFSVLAHSDKSTQRLAYYHLNWQPKKLQVTSKIQTKPIHKS